MLLLALMNLQSLPVSAQSFFHRIDSTLAARYYRKTGFDTTYISRPMTKWTITARANVSGAKIESEGMDQGVHARADDLRFPRDYHHWSRIRSAPMEQ